MSARAWHGIALAVVAGAAAIADPVAAQSYPTRPVRLIVAYAPGGSTDILARYLGVKLTEAWGQQVVIDNRPGGGGIIGTVIVQNANPDGYTLLMGTNGSHGINSSLFQKLPYDAVKDFAPVTVIAAVPMVLVVNANNPAKTVAELVATAKSLGDRMNYGSAGTGSTGHLAAEIFKSATGIKPVHLPYKSDGPVMVDLIGGRFAFSFSNMPATVAHIQGGRVRALGVSFRERSPALPDVPTIIEAGVPGFEIIPWYGVLAPAATPRAIVAKLGADINRVLGQPDFRERLSGLGATALGGTPERFAELIRSDVAKYAKAVKDSGTKVD